jgi:anhydro-N-acetylmuramic acid kinase
LNSVPLFVGVMSGTSMDAIDVAAVQFDGPRPHLVAAADHAWPADLVAELRGLAAGAALSPARFAQLEVLVAEQFACAVNELLQAARIDPGAVAAIGCHGQTVAHLPDATPPATLQLGDASTLAERTGITTVSDFRRRDLAAGGQGAPLAPAFHSAYLASPEEDRAVLNLGGIANLTLLPADAGRAPIGFDTGPANCLLDAWHRRHRQGAFDRDGKWAAGGKPDAALLDQLMADPYLATAPPKSTGTQYFSAQWLDRQLTGFAGLDPAAAQATLLEFTVETVARALERWMPAVQRLLVCGGGAHNLHLVQRLEVRTGITVESTEVYGIPPDWMEAMAFAWLAARVLQGKPGNLPSVTGARGFRLLGAIHPA